MIKDNDLTEDPIISSNIETENEPKKIRGHKKVKIIANVLNTEYDIVKNVLSKEMNCKLSYEYEDDKSLYTKDWDLYWNDLIVTPELLSKLKPFQKVNHFPGMESLTRKNLLGKNLNRMKKAYSHYYSFFPSTWLLPADWNEFKMQLNNGKSKTYIVKPEAQSKGKGIFLTKNLSSIRQVVRVALAPACVASYKQNTCRHGPAVTFCIFWNILL